ncbi:C2 domain-containing protein [Mucor mucedo]|uniref:C2 domain-containing protein n=1 Tax=Mucor mucedo TaxID=29922 RepID=UPI00221E545F|nr:C2 domain-containing protein [Mucor mucedo]KAI7888263.1 C2 domain-containing protein [Mucor mucedo]
MLSDSESTLKINVISASDLINVQTMGKQDPFLQLSLNFQEKDKFVKTFTHKDGGSQASWNQSFELPLNGEPDLFIEVLDKEASVDEVIGFAAIPIKQVVYADGAYLNGLFNIYDTDGNRAGLVHLQLAAKGFPNSETPNFDTEPVQGESNVNDEHCARMKSNEKKAVGVSVAGGLFGAGFAIGATLLGKKLYEAQLEEEEAERRAREGEEPVEE